ncbi:MAG: hypothetical protein QNJ72_33485 [Pleurocapsa sp. MO_226.B13]|nr:hypothetical protein [Pleurocapsa sp. MO_226.B13]
MTQFTKAEIVFIGTAVQSYIKPAENFLNNLIDSKSPTERLIAYVSGDLEKAINTAKTGNEIILKSLKSEKVSERRDEAIEEIKHCLKVIANWECALEKYKKTTRIVYESQN